MAEHKRIQSENFLRDLSRCLALIPEECYLSLLRSHYRISLNGNWRAGGYGRENHDIKDWYILNILEGEVKLFCDGKTALLSEGGIFLTNRSNPFMITLAGKKKTRISSCQFQFSPSQAYESLNRNCGPVFGAFHSSRLYRQDPLFKEISGILHSETCFGKGLASACLFKLLTGIYREFARVDSSSDINRVIDHLNRNPTVRLGLDDMADMAGYSRNTFIRRFKKATGKRPNEYLISLRINHAQFLLFEEKASVSRVSEFLGYKDAFSFSKQFKKSTGVTPSEYRERGILRLSPHDQPG